VGKAKSIKKRVASHFSNPSTRAGRDLLPMIDHVEALVVHTEAEALLTEQEFIKQYKPRFNIPLRDDKSYPYIAISLDEDFPRVYFTRRTPPPGPGLLRPVLQRGPGAPDPGGAGKVFMFRSVRGPHSGPGGAGRRALTYYIKRCGAPCVGYGDQGGSIRQSIDGVIAFLSGRYREIERRAGLRECAWPPAEQRYEDAARERNRLKSGAVAAWSASGCPTTRWARWTRSPSAVDSPRRCQCAGVPGARRSAVGPARASTSTMRAEADMADVAEAFILPVLRLDDGDPAAGGGSARGRGPIRTSRP